MNREPHAHQVQRAGGRRWRSHGPSRTRRGPESQPRCRRHRRTPRAPRPACPPRETRHVRCARPAPPPGPGAPRPEPGRGLRRAAGRCYPMSGTLRRPPRGRRDPLVVGIAPFGHCVLRAAGGQGRPQARRSAPLTAPDILGGTMEKKLAGRASGSRSRRSPTEADTPVQAHLGCRHGRPGQHLGDVDVGVPGLALAPVHRPFP